MSHIAAALAKSKGKTVTPPPAGTVVAPPVALPVAPPKAVTRSPFRAPAVVAAPAPPVEKKKFPMLTVVIVGMAVSVLLGLGWMFTRPAEEAAVAAPAAVPHPAPAVAATTTTPALPPPATASVTPVATPVTPSTTVKPPPATTVPASPGQGEMADAVMRLNISAIKPGTNPGVTIGGKLYRPGDPVTSQLTLEAVEVGNVIFRDADGHLYPRRY